LPAYFQLLYRVLKQANLPSSPPWPASLLHQRGRDEGGPGMGVWLAGLCRARAEHVNYYHYQLMYDTRAAFASLRRNGRLRKAALGLDLQRRAA
jgi:hypothetical protein